MRKTVSIAQLRAKRIEKIRKSIGGLGEEYRPVSRSPKMNINTPDSMFASVNMALSFLKKELGDIDEFVRQALGYADMDDLQRVFFAEQIDALALGIYNIEARGQSLIVADQTGIGKGRVAAGMIRYAAHNGILPIFLTEKDNLFSDMYRDLIDIHSADLVPFIVNARAAKTNITDKEGNVIYRAEESQMNKRVIESGELPSKYDVVVATYTQFSQGEYDNKGKYKGTSPKLAFLRSIAPNSIVIMDESHNAAGNSYTGQNLMSVVKLSKGGMFLSATFAKRPENMPIYAIKTSMSEAELSDEALTNAIVKGGVALQEVVSSDLVSQGQMLRRERGFENIEVNYLYSTGEVAKKQRATADTITEIMRNIKDFQKEYISAEVKKMDTIAKGEGGEAEFTTGTNMAGVDNQPFVSRIFQTVNQMLFSLKADEVVKRAIFRLKQGKAPVIAFSSTMGSFLDKLNNDASEMGVDGGLRVNADFASVLQAGLDGVLRYTVTDGYGKKTYNSFSPTDFGQAAQEQYDFIQKKIAKASTDIVISPIDLIKQQLEDAGYRVAEVTKRNLALKLEKKGNRYVGSIYKRPQMTVNEAFRRFQNNEVDVLMINQSGSTGASAHAVPTSKVPASEVRQRVMIVLQAELDINREIQKRGRINRTGQIKAPIFDYITSDIPAEKRFMMMLQKKLKSLDANTTANQKSSEAILSSEDFLNKFGDIIVREYLSENPELNEELDEPIGKLEESDGSKSASEVAEGTANKVSGRVALLSSADQEDFYTSILTRYRNYVAFLLESDKYDLEVEVLDLKAETISKDIAIANANQGVSPFSDNTYLEKCEVNMLKKPLTKDEVEDRINAYLKGKDREKVNAELIQDAKDYLIGQVQESDAKIDLKYDIKISEITTEKGYREANGDMEQIKYVRERTQALNDGRDAQKNRNKLKLSNQFSLLQSNAKFYTAGKMVKILDEEDPNDSLTIGIVTSWKIGSAKNKYAPSNVTMEIAVASSQQTITLDLTDKNRLMLSNTREQSRFYQEYSRNLSEYEKAVKNATSDRYIRHIATGNLLQWYGQSEIPKGKLVEYTTKDGRVLKGALLPESFSRDANNNQVSSNPNRKVAAIPVNLAVPVIRELKRYSPMELSEDVTITSDGYNTFTLTVPSKSDSNWAYLDAELRTLVKNGEFTKRGTKMYAYFEGSELKAVTERLWELRKVKAPLTQEQFDSLEEFLSNNTGTATTQVKRFVPPSRPNPKAKLPKGEMVIVPIIKAKKDKVKIVLPRKSQSSPEIELDRIREAEARARRIRIIALKLKMQA